MRFRYTPNANHRSRIEHRKENMRCMQAKCEGKILEKNRKAAMKREERKLRG